MHVYGAARVLNQAELIDTLRASTEMMESGRSDPWSYGELESDLGSALTNAIAGFEIEVSRVEAKFKLGQNRSEADINQVRYHLLESGFASDTELANLMGSLNTRSGHGE